MNKLEWKTIGSMSNGYLLHYASPMGEEHDDSVELYENSDGTFTLDLVNIDLPPGTTLDQAKAAAERALRAIQSTALATEMESALRAIADDCDLPRASYSALEWRAIQRARKALGMEADDGE